MVSDEGDATTPSALTPLVRQRTILLKTKKRDGTWVGTPVNIAVRGDRGYVRTHDKSWKSKRLRNFPEVRFAPSTVRGRPTGPEVYARARLLDGEEAGAAAGCSLVLYCKYPPPAGLLRPVGASGHARGGASLRAE
ncbi:MAG: PPOX class F420-dependent oxidoreductase [Acidimicrobiales bacterium]